MSPRYTRADLKARIAELEEEVARLKEENLSLGYEIVSADIKIAQQDQALLEKNAEIESLTQNAADWKAYAESLEAQVAEKQGMIDTLNGTLLGAFDEMARLNSEIARLKAELEACKNPPVSAPPSTFGSSTGKHSYDYFTQMAGAPLKVRRSYDVWPAVHPREDAGRNASVWSFKPPVAQFAAGQLDSQFVTALNTIPDDGYGRYVIIYHEPEDNIEKGDFTYTQYKDMQKRARTLIDKVNATRKTKIRFGGNWMAWSFQSASNRNPENYWPGAGVWDFLALDGYAQGRTPAGVFDKALAFCRSKGVRFAVAETGIDVSRPEAERVAWIKECRNYAKNANCEFWCYWDGSFSTFWLNTEAEFKAVVLGS